MEGQSHTYAMPTTYDDGQTEIAIQLTSGGLHLNYYRNVVHACPQSYVLATPGLAHGAAASTICIKPP